MIHENVFCLVFEQMASLVTFVLEETIDKVLAMKIFVAARNNNTSLQQMKLSVTQHVNSFLIRKVYIPITAQLENNIWIRIGVLNM